MRRFGLPWKLPRLCQPLPPQQAAPKRRLALALAVLLLVGLLAACGAAVGASPGPASAPQSVAPGAMGKKTTIVCSIFPLYDWARQLLGEATHDVELQLLVGNGVDLHSYQPSVEDVVTIAGCDLFVYVGGESDAWVEDALAQAPGVLALNLLDVLGARARAEELVEGMQGGEAEEESLDEHVWLSLQNAQLCCAAICEALCQIGTQTGTLAKTVQANTAAYTEKLAALDAQYRQAADAAATKALLFCDRFPFRYLLDDYGLAYYAAFPGCSAETEASFETVAFLAETLNELGLETVLVSESADKSIAQTIINTTKSKNQTILVLNALQSITQGDADSGATYLGLMEKNLAVLQEALG